MSSIESSPNPPKSLEDELPEQVTVEVEEPAVQKPTKPKKSTKNLKPTTTLTDLFQEVQFVTQSSVFKRFSVQFHHLYTTLPIETFFSQITACINHILSVRRKESKVDNVLKFLVQGFNYLQEKGVEELDKLSERLIKYYFKGIETKDKWVRSRTISLIANWLDYLGPIEETFYLDLRQKLTKRLNDKDSQVRVQTVLALSRLQAETDPNDPDELVTELINVLQFDPTPDVRKTTLTNLVQNERTVPYLIERTRDIDTSTRKQVFSKTMVEYGDFRALTIQQREAVLKAGVTDRDPTVKKACNSLLCEVWMPLVSNDLVELLEKLDVMTSDVASLTLTEFFNNNLDSCKQLSFPPDFFNSLTVEGAYLVKVFVEYLHTKQMHEKFDQVVPTAFEMCNLLGKYCSLAEETDDDETKESYDFIVQQLLEITTYLDLADEAGRRRLFELLRQLGVKGECTQDQIKLLVQILRILATDELDFTRTIVDLVSDIQESTGEPLSTELIKQVEQDLESQDEEALQQRTPFLNAVHKCLVVVKFMLEICEVTFAKNPMLSGILKDLIEPTANCDISALQDAGTECLGLCCLLDQRLAERNLITFMHSATNKADNLPEVRTSNLKIIFDIFCMYGIGPKFNLPDDKIQGFMKTVLKDTNPTCLAIAAQGITKLYLTGIYSDTEVLRRLIILYFIPSTHKNLSLRQCLHYFLEVYPRVSSNHQQILGATFVPTILEMVALHIKFSKRYHMITPLQVGHQLADWTDPRKLLDSDQPDYVNELKKDNEELNDLHLILAIQLIKASFDKDDEIRKLLFHTLVRLAIDTMRCKPKLKALDLLIKRVFQEGIPTDSVSTNTLNKLQLHCAKFDLDLSDEAAVAQEVKHESDPDDRIFDYESKDSQNSPIEIKAEVEDLEFEISEKTDAQEPLIEIPDSTEVKLEPTPANLPNKNPNFSHDPIYTEIWDFLQNRPSQEIYQIPNPKLKVPKSNGTDDEPSKKRKPSTSTRAKKAKK